MLFTTIDLHPSLIGNRVLQPVIEAVSLEQYDAPKGEIFQLVSPVKFEKNPIEIVLGILLELRELPDNWDGEGGIGISDIVIINTLYFLIQIPNKYLYLLDEDSFTPTSYGTIVIDWYNNDDKNNLSIEIGHSKIGFFIKENGKFTDYSDGLKFNAYDVPEQIVKAFKSVIS